MLKELDSQTNKGTGAHHEANASPDGQKTTLHMAVSNNNFKYVCDILEKGTPDVNQQDVYGRTALHLAAWHNYDDLVEEILNHKPGVDIEDNAGMTPLHYAVENVNLTAVCMLIHAGANVSVTDKRGFNCFDYAKKHKNRGIIKCLEMAARHPPTPGGQQEGSKKLRKSELTLLSSNRVHFVELLKSRQSTKLVDVPKEKAVNALLQLKPAVTWGHLSIKSKSFLKKELEKAENGGD